MLKFIDRCLVVQDRYDLAAVGDEVVGDDIVGQEIWHPMRTDPVSRLLKVADRAGVAPDRELPRVQKLRLVVLRREGQLPDISAGGWADGLEGLAAYGFT